DERSKIFTVEINGKPRRFTTPELSEADRRGAEFCQHVLLDFAAVGVKAPDPHTLVVTLINPTPYFRELTAFYTLAPVNRKCVEQFGSPAWTKPENLVVNGPFKLEFRRIRDRIRLVKNPTYWDQENVKLDVVDVLAIQSEQTALNMYLSGKADWTPYVPTYVIPDLRKRPDFQPKPFLSTYFYRVNTTREGLKDRRVRQALSMALDRNDVLKITEAGEVPAFAIVPPGMPGYTSPQSLPFDVAKAKQLLAEAGYPEGRGFPRIEILYNNNDAHRVIAEVLQNQWKRNLGIQVDLKNQEWASYLEAQRSLAYSVARAGWVGDFNDPMTFLDLWMSNNPNNETGWKNPEYDRLINDALKEPDEAKRLALLQQAEGIFVEELPAIPIYFYVDKNLVRPYVKGFYHNLLDLHPLQSISIDREEKARIFQEEGLK
ncbi:MAG TPA: peptide ABC transporter substrate-binding protein, partial [Pirellulales bacterium]